MATRSVDGALRHGRAVVLALLPALGCFAESPVVDPGADDFVSSECEAIEMAVDTPECPEVCNGGCEEGECLIECRDDAPCRAQSIACPAEFLCDLDCAGDGVCEGTVLTCPSDFPCSLTCEGANACLSAELRCGFSECSIECGADPTACAATAVGCGVGPCIAECSSAVGPALERCEDSCACTDC